MRRDAFIDLCLRGCNPERLVERLARDRPSWYLAGKQQWTSHFVRFPMLPQQCQPHLREHCAPLLVSFAVFDMDLPPRAVNILDAQLTDLADSQPRAEGKHRNRTHAQRQMFQEAFEFFSRQYGGQPSSCLQSTNASDCIGSIQRRSIQEAQRRRVDVVRRGGNLVPFYQFQQVRPDFRLTKRLRGLAKMATESRHAPHVRLLRILTSPSEFQILLHPVT